ncbi:hypothetical protein pb186bvf_011284 [Paramecium bursaria]
MEKKILFNDILFVYNLQSKIQRYTLKIQNSYFEYLVTQKYGKESYSIQID